MNVAYEPKITLFCWCKRLATRMINGASYCDEHNYPIDKKGKQ